MVPQKFTCPSRSDDIGNLYINSNTKRYGFFANESQDSKYFESGRHRSFKAKRGFAGEQSNRSDRRRRYGNDAIVVYANNQLLIRGKTSWSEYLKEEPVYDTTMFHETDCEYFQDLVQWCSDPAKEEQTLTIDSKKYTEERAHQNNTLHTPFSPSGWEIFDTTSPSAATGMYCTTPNELFSPKADALKFQHPLSPSVLNDHNKMHYTEQFLDFNNMPVVIGDLGSEKMVDMDPAQTTGLVGWNFINNTDDNINTHHITTQNTMPFIDAEETKLLSVIPREQKSNDVIITEVIFGAGGKVEKPVVAPQSAAMRRGGLTVNIPARVAGWPADFISTPDVVRCVEQLENDASIILPSIPADWPVEDTGFVSTDVSLDVKTPPQLDYEPITPKSESQVESDNDEKSYTRSRKRRYDSDSDETYTPSQEHTPRRKYTRRKTDVPIKDMIKALECSQPLQKPKRGRPPKRRESTVSSVCSVDENNTTPAYESKYRELRDKNNEASKRSRMNRKLKELQVEQQAKELEESNKRLQIRADILEDMTKRLKDALMTAILQKK